MREFACLFALRFRLEALIGVGALVSGGLDREPHQIYVARPRPADPSIHIAAHLSDYSFPSGHVIQYTTLFGFCCYVVYIAWRNTWLRNLVLVALAATILLVGPSRVYLGEHWPSDVLGAYLFSAIWLAVTIEAHRLKRRFESGPCQKNTDGTRASALRPHSSQTHGIVSSTHLATCLAKCHLRSIIMPVRRLSRRSVKPGGTRQENGLRLRISWPRQRNAQSPAPAS